MYLHKEEFQQEIVPPIFDTEHIREENLLQEVLWKKVHFAQNFCKN
jgi:hypothetical protein